MKAPFAFLFPLAAIFGSSLAVAYEPCSDSKSTICEPSGVNDLLRSQPRDYGLAFAGAYVKNVKDPNAPHLSSQVADPNSPLNRNLPAIIRDIEKPYRSSLQANFKKIQRTMVDAIKAHPALNRVQKNEMIERVRQVRLQTAEEALRSDRMGFRMTCGALGQSYNAYFDSENNSVTICPGAAVGRSSSDMIGVLAHELGHSIDLANFPYAYDSLMKCAEGSRFGPGQSFENKNQVIADFWSLQVAGRMRMGPTGLARNYGMLCLDKTGRADLVVMSPTYRKLFLCPMDDETRTCDIRSSRVPSSIFSGPEDFNRPWVPRSRSRRPSR